ncbi:MAG: hypothetical protein OCD01_09855 [Fibrobacterales bacterium]
MRNFIVIISIMCLSMAYSAETDLFNFDKSLQVSMGYGLLGVDGSVKYLSNETVYGVTAYGALALTGNIVSGLEVLYGKGFSSDWLFGNMALGVGLANVETFELNIFPDMDSSSDDDGYYQGDNQSSESLGITPTLSGYVEGGIKIYCVGIGLKAHASVSTDPLLYVGLFAVVDIPLGDF